MRPLLLTLHLMGDPRPSPPVFYTPAVPMSVLHAAVDPAWLFIGMALGAALSSFTIGGVIVAVHPRGFNL